LITTLIHLIWNFDNNSNGNVELKIEIIAGILVVDSDSNGKPEQLDAVKAMSIDFDKNDDGIMDSNVSYGYVYLVTDKNEDTKPEFQQALFYCAWNFDNNSNGYHEWSRQAIAGFILKETTIEALHMHFIFWTLTTMVTLNTNMQSLVTSINGTITPMAITKL
jgi:hypothetical protein